MPTEEEKKNSVEELRRKFEAIDADFNTAIEQCRTEEQRAALRSAHQKARKAFLLALRDTLVQDSEAWKNVKTEFNAGKADAERVLAGLQNASAVVRILAQLTGIAAQLAILAA